MKVFRSLALAIFCFAPVTSFAAISGSHTVYSCYFLDEFGKPKSQGYRIKVWFDTCVDASFTAQSTGTSISCQLDIFGTSPGEAVFDCKVNEQLMTLTINKESLRAKAKFMEGNAYDMRCNKR